MGERIYLSPPDVGTDEEAAVLAALRSGWVAPNGPEVDAFERELAAFTGRRFAVALSSGTAALHLGLLCIDVRPGDVVLTASMTFAATANAIVYTGARPVFVDCDATGNVDVGLLGAALLDQRRRGRRVAAIVPVDVLGRIANYEEIDRLAAEHGVPVLADAAESLGSTRNFQPAGSFGRVAAVSFNGNKIMTTSGGGALVTDDRDLADRARYLSTQARQPVVHYEHTEIGYNYRLSNLLAALGRAQLRRLPDMIAKREGWREHYAELFSTIDGVRLLAELDSSFGVVERDNCWLTSVVVDSASAGFSSDALIRQLQARDIEARPLWKPMHLQPVFQAAESYVNGTSEYLFANGVSLPSGSAMTFDQWSRVADAVCTVASAKVPA